MNIREDVIYARQSVDRKDSIYILYSCAITPMGNTRRSILPLRACSCALLQRFDDLARFGIDQRLIVNEGRRRKVRSIRLCRNAAPCRI